MFINNFDPVAFNFFSLEIRWYSLAYIFGIIIGWVYSKKYLINDKSILNIFDDLITYLIIGVILGGRLGYILFYNLDYYLNNLNEVLMLWKGGMSFHGGVIGVVISTILFSKKHNINSSCCSYWNFFRTSSKFFKFRTLRKRNRSTLVCHLSKN